MTTEAQERLAAGRQRAAKATAEQMLEAANAGRTEITQEDVFKMQQRPTRAGDSPTPVAQRPAGMEGATVTHQSPGLVRMFKPTPQGYQPRTIPASNIGMVVRAGWLAACPDCGRSECGANGDQNDCPNREPRMYRVCPVASCITSGGFRHRIYDPIERGRPEDDAPADPNRIVDNLAERSTPEERTWTEMAAHLMAFHPKEAPRYGAVPVIVTAPALQPQVGTQAGQR